MFGFYNYGFGKHTYTLAATGIRIGDRVFSSREAANRAMYRLLGKYGLSVQEVYDDGHFKTYICQNNIRFYINRE